MASGINKRLWGHLSALDRSNADSSSNSVKFIIDESPFHGNQAAAASPPPTNASSEQSAYSIVIGRILPKSEPYNRSAFKIELKIPHEFPFKPPEVRMITKIYHPNIGPEGKICIPMLRSTEGWKSNYTLADVVRGTTELIDHPKVEEAFSNDIAREYTGDRATFDRKVEQTINENLLPRS